MGIARAEAKITLANLVYNIDRLIFHEGQAATQQPRPAKVLFRLGQPKSRLRAATTE